MSVARINTNENALFAARNLGIVDRNMQTTLERLSTGLRINKAADDPSGLQVATNFQHAIRGTQTAIQNAEDVLGMLHYADEALGGITDTLIKMSDLALKASNEAVVTSADQMNFSYEFKKLKEAIKAQGEGITFNGKKLMVGSYAALTDKYTYYYLSQAAGGTYRWSATCPVIANTASIVFAFGANSGGMLAQIGADNGAVFQITVTFGTMTLTALGLTGGVTTTYIDDWGGNQAVNFGGFGSTTFNPSGTSVKYNASYALKWKDYVDSAINKVGNTRAAIGVLEQRMQSVIDNLSTQEVNLVAAKSRIMDADMAQEISDLVRLQVISQAGIAALTQANIQPQKLLALLGVGA